MSILSEPRFHCEEAAYDYIERHIWPDGPICPHCEECDSTRITKLKGKSTRIGTYKCKTCRKPFTVKVGTIFESSHVKMHLWLQAIYLMASSKKGFSSNQLHRTLGVTLKTAWFMSHRIREAMREGILLPLGGPGKIVEADETYYGKIDGPPPEATTSGRPFTSSGRKGPSGKRAILGLHERKGKVRYFHIKQATKINVAKLVKENIDRESSLYTDESRLYKGMDQHFAEHEHVRHSTGEFAREKVHSNTIESSFSIFKRGMRGIYQHCGESHLHRYLAEFSFRHNHRSDLGWNDADRATSMLMGAIGKRLTYEVPEKA
ncbi:MAG: IS1595 family transposase [Nitratireductor sp.]|nr:IS1595 family transposase [Nitratireductor sp.]